MLCAMDTPSRPAKAARAAGRLRRISAGRTVGFEVKMEMEIEIGVGVVVGDVFVWLARDDSLDTSDS